MAKSHGHGEIAGAQVSGVFGIWLNKRRMLALEIPLRHTISPQHNGWRLDLLEPGKLIVRNTEGMQRIDVDEGDYVISTGDDLYLALHRPQVEDGEGGGETETRADDRRRLEESQASEEG
jgi:hypothetical protein